MFDEYSEAERTWERWIFPRLWRGLLFRNAPTWRKKYPVENIAARTVKLRVGGERRRVCDLGFGISP
jgi:hypothetical protein